MIQIILQILSIIGIILLVILGLVLLVVGVILFVPVRYVVRMQKGNQLLLFLKAHWLLHLLTVRYEYPERQAVVVKLAGITIYDSKKPKQPKKTNKKKKKTEEKAEVPVENDVKASTEEMIQPKAVEAVKQTEIPKKKKNIFRKIIDFFKKLKYTISHFCDTIKNVIENIEYYIEFFQEEQTIAVLKNGKERLFKILKKLAPKKLEADILFGTGSPDTTGYALALYGMLSPYLGKHVNITSDFENAVFEGRIFAKGRIKIFTLIVNIWYVVCDENFKPVIKKFKRED